MTRQEQKEQASQENKQKDQPVKRRVEQFNLDEYKAFKEKESKKFKGIKIPKPVQIILLIPCFIVFLFSLLYIPYLAFQLFLVK